MSDKCEHGWTSPPECPSCAANERDDLRQKLDAAHAEKFELIHLNQKLSKKLDAITQERDNLAAEEVRRIKHLNRLATWAQQDPTGPICAQGIQQWVLAELKAALGTEYQPSQFQVETHIVEDLRNQLGSAVRESSKRLETITKLTQERDRALAACAAKDEALRSAQAAFWDGHYSGKGITVEYAQGVDKEVREALAITQTLRGAE